MDDLEPLRCIECVREEHPISEEADGWALLFRSTDEGDDHDDQQWKCPDCASESDKEFGDPQKLVEEALREDDSA